MESLFTISNITFGLGILGIMFGVYKYFRDPQVNSEKKDALLAQQVQWTKEATEIRFKEINENFSKLVTQSQNHIHTLDTKIDEVNKTVSLMGNEITKLSTIIEERIPKKYNG